MSDRFFVFGAGYSGKAFGRAYGAFSHVAGTTRSPEKHDALRAAGIEPFTFDGTALDDRLLAELGEVTHLIQSIAPGDGGDPVLSQIGEGIPSLMPKLAWVGYLSTVGVYGDHGGEWVGETAECRPVSHRSVLRLEAENTWRTLGEHTSLPVAILRLSGIYGPGRNALVNLENGTAKRLVKPGQVFNRIHVDDIASALGMLAGRRMSGVFNVTDDEPAPPQDVVAFAAELMGVAPPPEQDFASAQISPMARSFYGENKRVSNGRIKAEGYAFRYPNYRVSHSTMWTDGTWRGEGSADGRSSIGGA